MRYSYDRITSKRRIRQRIHRVFVERLDYAPDFYNPQTYNEKIQWLKLNYRDPLITQCADKYLVRQYVSETIGEQYLVGLLGVYTRAEDIDYDSLPDKFVLKANNGWNKNIICTNKAGFEAKIENKIMNKWLSPLSDHYYSFYEWAYKNIPRRIICEEYLETSDKGGLIDYKFHCFNGQPKFIGACSQRQDDLKIDYYDTNWALLPFSGKQGNSDRGVKKPKSFDEMMKLAKILSKPFPFVRVDFFEVDGKVIFGELTFYPNAGFSQIDPLEWDYKIGDMLELPKNKNPFSYTLYRLRNALGQSITKFR